MPTRSMWCCFVVAWLASHSGAADITVPPGLKFEPDLTYRVLAKSGKKLALDLARPAKPKSSLPVVVILHGSGGDRKDMLPMVFDLAQQGYVAVTVGYRFPVPFPEPFYDVQAAVTWLRANADKHHIDKTKVAAVGFSAGAGFAQCLGMVTAKDDFANANDPNAKESFRVQAVISCCGPTELTKLYRAKSLASFFLRPQLETYLGGPPEKRQATYDKASPLTYARAGSAPMLLIHGRADNVVPLAHSKRLLTKLKEAGCRASLLELEGGHDIRSNAKDLTKATKAIHAFLKAEFTDEK